MLSPRSQARVSSMRRRSLTPVSSLKPIDAAEDEESCGESFGEPPPLLAAAVPNAKETPLGAQFVVARPTSRRPDASGQSKPDAERRGNAVVLSTPRPRPLASSSSPLSLFER